MAGLNIPGQTSAPHMVYALLQLLSATHLFLSCVSMPMHAEYNIVTANLSVCLVTRCYCIETNTYIVKLFAPSGRGMTSFLGLPLLQNSMGNSLSWG